jgi:hypothetical protein
MSSPAETLYPELTRPLGAVRIIDQSKRVQLPGHAQASPPPPVRDTMAPAPAVSKVEDVAAARPRLTLPRNFTVRPSLEVAMIGAQDLGSRSMRELVVQARESFLRECGKYKELNKEAIDAWFKSLDAAEATNAWTLFRRFANYFGSAALLVGGAAAAASAPASGGSSVYAYLMVAAALNIGNAAMIETGGYQKLASFFTSNDETAARIATGMQIGSTAIAVSTGLISGYAASSVLQNANLVDMATKTATNAGALAGGVAAIGEGVSKGKAKDAEVHQLRAQLASSDHRQDMHRYTHDVEQVAKGEQRADGVAGELVRIHSEMLETIAAGG